MVVIFTSPEPPPVSVLQGFCLSGSPIKLNGGEGQSFLVGDVVLKPTNGDDALAEWVRRTLYDLPQVQTIRTLRPLITSDGKFVSAGWTAAVFMRGDTDVNGRWEDLLEAARRFHTLTKNISCRAVLKRRTDRWAIADRIAWDEEQALEVFSPLQGCFNRLVSLRTSVTSSIPQIIHGDLCGNVLFADEYPPGIIDFSPYWRPPEYAEAIIVADGLLDKGEREYLIRLVGVSGFRIQMLVRALLFRLMSWSNHCKTYVYLVSNGYENNFKRAIDLVELVCTTCYDENKSEHFTSII